MDIKELGYTMGNQSGKPTHYMGSDLTLWFAIQRFLLAEDEKKRIEEDIDKVMADIKPRLRELRAKACLKE